MDESREAKVAAAKARMIELAGKFITRTRGELETMRAGAERLRTGDASALGEIRHLAHKMAGTGATLGFETLGDLASGLERYIDSRPTGAAPDDATQTRVAADIVALEAQLAEDENAREGI